MRQLDWPQIQAFILRGYALTTVRYFVLQVTDAAAARSFLGRLVGAGAPAPLQLTTAAVWAAGEPQLDYGLNVGITWTGLLALGAGILPDLSFRSFPAFMAGSAARASVVGDTGSSAPENWTGGLGSGNDHLLLSLFGPDGASLESLSERLRGLFTGALRELAVFTGGALPGRRVHFGYRDGISQPTIEGGPSDNIPDAQPVSPAWNFVLLDDPAAGYYVPTPQPLGLNGSFGVFRILRQDVAEFERFLARHRSAIDPELLAAKMCGRWRNGVPLALSPASDTPDPPVPQEGLNDFDYVPSPGKPAGFDDREGDRTPLGSHIRRANPRGETVQGGGGHDHRLVRRGLPYGPVYDPARPDGEERGLLGFFINARIETQFEFVMQAWLNDGGFAAGLPGDETDPLVGDRHAGTDFSVPQAGPVPSLTLPGLSRFVTTRGSAYCFLPSVSALQFLAAIGSRAASGGPSA
jgi:Dyp-type peroxidase family